MASLESALPSSPARLFERLHSVLPRGGSLPLDEWSRRHRVLVVALWLNVLVLSTYGLASGGYGPLHNVAHAGRLLTFAVLASSSSFSPKMRSALVSLGL